MQQESYCWKWGVFYVFCIMAVSKQQLSKHVPAATDKCNNRITVFSMWSMPRSYNQDRWSNENEHVRGIGQGEARHRKYKRLKLGGGQAYDRSSD
jgi:hypothetical protein